MVVAQSDNPKVKGLNPVSTSTKRRGKMPTAPHSLLFIAVIEQHILDTNAGKQQSIAATDV